MKVFKAIKDIKLTSSGHPREFKKGEEVHENIYTELYPQFFKKVGDLEGYQYVFAKPLFIPDPIDEFNEKEDKRKKEKKAIKEVKEVKEVNEIDELIEGTYEEPVKIETEE